MKVIVLLLAIYIFCSGVMYFTPNKCNCGTELKMFYKGKLVRIKYMPKGLRVKKGIDTYIRTEGEKTILVDSLDIRPVP